MFEPRNINVAIGAVAGVAGAIIGTMMMTHVTPANRGMSVDQALAQTSNQVNKMLPMMVDSETRLDSTTPGPDKSLIYKYTLVNRTKNQVNTPAVVAIMRPMIAKNYRTSEQMKTIRDAGVTLHYLYYDKNGVYVTEIVVHAND